MLTGTAFRSVSPTAPDSVSGGKPWAIDWSRRCDSRTSVLLAGLVRWNRVVLEMACLYLLSCLLETAIA